MSTFAAWAEPQPPHPKLFAIAALAATTSIAAAGAPVGSALVRELTVVASSVAEASVVGRSERTLEASSSSSSTIFLLEPLAEGAGLVKSGRAWTPSTPSQAHTLFQCSQVLTIASH
ncbi:hypothetical protein GUJ93_ZPchr0004g38331 [Zizania palustris]|uniref:Uncharacterized protein n=1 Tax=Zizania palustris TaxID=103762 RepID=A0A8J5VFQ4_ZIZPA|nr:hypothetical protein GUJ93_ZPchr0004g38331 [Zizania palustris]